MIAQGARGMIDFHQPSTKVQCINWAYHDASGTAVASVVVHLEQVSSGRHDSDEGVLVHGVYGILLD